MTKGMKDSTFISAGGSVKRPFKDHYGDILNVKSFGAVGDGVNNDQPAIQAALIEAFGDPNSPEGLHGEFSRYKNKPVYFPAGIYRILAPLEITEMQYGWIYGESSEASIIKYEGPIGTTAPVLSVTVSTTAIGRQVTGMTVTTPGVGFPPNNHYWIAFDEVSGLIDRAVAHVNSNPDGTITTSSIQIDYGGMYGATDPGAIVNACTAALRTNGMRHAVMERLGIDIPVGNGSTIQTCCMMIDKWKSMVGMGAGPLQNSFYDIATKNSDWGWLMGFTGDRGPQYGGTSTATITVGTGSKVFTGGTRQFGGSNLYLRCRVTTPSDPSVMMEGPITASTGSAFFPTVTINVDTFTGSGTFSNWQIGPNGYTGFNSMGSETLFVNCNCTDHSWVGIRNCNANVLSQNVIGGVFTRCGNIARGLADPGDQSKGGAALHSGGGSFSFIDGATFINNPNMDYYGEGATGIVFQNINIINTLGDNGLPFKGSIVGRFPQPTIMRNVKHSNVNTGAGQILFWLYEAGTVIEGCTFGYGMAQNADPLVFMRLSSFANGNTPAAIFPNPSPALIKEWYPV